MEVKRSQGGQSLIEILVAAFILGTLAIALAGVSTLGTKTAVVSEQRTVAQALANQRSEIIKVTPYLDVGYSDGGTPDGVFLSSETVARNNQSYEIRMDITLVDDPANGCVDLGPCDSSAVTEETADYKKVVISIKYPAADDVTKEVKVSTISVAGQAAALLSLVQCDPTDISGPCGAGQACCDERCLPVCEPGACPDGYTCATNGCGCVPDSCSWCTEDTTVCFSDFECEATNQQCVEGICVAACTVDTDCPSGESCIYGICQAPCTVNGECNNDQICQGGVCRPPGCLDDSGCRNGYSCVDWQCQPTDCADASFCPPNFECVENTCLPASCGEGTCPGSWVCVAGSCQPPWCTAGQSCNGAACVEQKCQPATCANHEQCQGDAVCIGAVCSSPPACPPACPAALACVNGECVNPNRVVGPLVLTAECPAPLAFPCLPAVGAVTVTWLPVEGEIYCEPSIAVTACTTSSDPAVEWSDTDGDGVTNCGPPGTSPAINACTPLKYPLECGSSDPGWPSCPANESCIEGRCMPDQPCPVDYANHPTLAGKCIEEVSVAPPVTCPGSCPGGSYCVGVACVTAGCLTDEQCALDGNYMCRNNVCVPKKDRDCSYCIPPERTKYCYNYDCATCDGGPGSACTDALGATGTVVWAQNKTNGCDYLTCEYAPSVCGNGIVQPGEDCELGDTCPDPPPGTACAGDCSCPAPVCGNNAAEEGEECDGTDDASCPGQCTGSCLCPEPTPGPLCGNGVVDSGAGEACDPTATPNGCAPLDFCESDCLCYPSGQTPLPTCGNGILDPGENCDGAIGCTPGDICVNCVLCEITAPTP